MGKIGAAVLVAVISYFSFSVYSIYRETQPPVYTPGIKGGGGGEEAEDGPPPVSTNLLSSSLLLTYHFFVSPVPSLPPLKNLLASKNTRLYVHLGSIHHRPYNWEGELRLEEEVRRSMTAWERFREACNFSGKEKPDVEVLLPSFLRTNSTLFFHVRSLDEKTGDELPLQSVQRLSAAVVPEHLKVFKRFLLKDPWGEKLREETKNLPLPCPPVESVPEYIQVSPVIEHRPLRTEALLKTFGAGSPIVDLRTQRYILPVHLNTFISPQDEYLPLISLPHENFVLEPEEKNRSVALTPIKIKFKPMGYASWIFLLIMGQALGNLQNMQLSDYDVNSMRVMMGSSSPGLLLLVYLISVLHLIFEGLALYSDVKFWRHQQNASENFSASGILIDMALELTTILYLRDNGDSLLVQCFIFLRLLLNIWKLKKLVTFTISSTPPYFFKIRQSPASSKVKPAEGDSSKEKTEKHGEKKDEEKTKERKKGRGVDVEELQKFENKCMWCLFLLLLPLVLGVSVYQLVYVPHKGWWSWVITSLATCAYTFGFVSMTPQLFRNYKLQSVTHMPWTVLGYQFTNTFIDDVFSCFIRMPKMHRMSVFRDDVVFIVFLIQRYLYRHSKKRSYDDEEEEEEEAAGDMSDRKNISDRPKVE